MIFLTCPCLNVRISGKESSLLKEVPTLPLPVETTHDMFFAPDTYVVTLDLGGVSISQSILCKERDVGGWTVVSCICCIFDIYARYMDEQDRVLVSCNAQKDQKYISSMMDCYRYSHLFKVLLPDINDNFIQNNLGLEPPDPIITQVKNRVSIYLEDEKRAMDERIRQFTAFQLAEYDSLVKRNTKHKEAMVYLLLKYKQTQQSNLEVASSAASLTAPTAQLSRGAASAIASSTSADSAFDKNDVPEHPPEKISKKHNHRSLRRTVSNPGRSANKKRGAKKPPMSIDVEGVFDMEEFNSGNENFNEDSGADSDSNAEDFPENSRKTMYATSLPMSIPSFHHCTRFSIMSEEEEKASLPKDPSEIAASIHALAYSVHDGTEMFGELPRRRLNTGELLSSRPL